MMSKWTGTSPKSVLLSSLCLAILATVPVLAENPSADPPLLCLDEPFVYNEGAGSDVHMSPSDMLPCNGPTYALCYYSGPEPRTCKVAPGGKSASCECILIDAETSTAGPGDPHDYFVEISGILNRCVYEETVKVCGEDGARCFGKSNMAPVCHYINHHPQVLMPDAEVISTFSLYQAERLGIGCTDCAEASYAGCMTAPCKLEKDGDEVIAVCECPIWDGPYQVGQSGQSCTLEEGLVWSAAYDPKGCPEPPSGD